AALSSVAQRVAPLVLHRSPLARGMAFLLGKARSGDLDAPADLRILFVLRGGRRGAGGLARLLRRLRCRRLRRFRGGYFGEKERGSERSGAPQALHGRSPSVSPTLGWFQECKSTHEGEASKR